MKTTSLRIFIFTLRSRLDTDKHHVVRGGRIIKDKTKVLSAAGKSDTNQRWPNIIEGEEPHRWRPG